jgi:hypothetical protein
MFLNSEVTGASLLSCGLGFSFAPSILCATEIFPVHNLRPEYLSFPAGARLHSLILFLFTVSGIWLRKSRPSAGSPANHVGFTLSRERQGRWRKTCK